MWLVDAALRLGNRDVVELSPLAERDLFRGREREMANAGHFAGLRRDPQNQPREDAPAI